MSYDMCYILLALAPMIVVGLVVVPLAACWALYLAPWLASRRAASRRPAVAPAPSGPALAPAPGLALALGAARALALPPPPPAPGVTPGPRQTPWHALGRPYDAISVPRKTRRFWGLGNAHANAVSARNH